MKLFTTISMACVGIGFMQIASCQNINDKKKVNPRIIYKVESTTGGLIAVLDKHEYANGLLTSEEDRISIIDPRLNKKDGFIVFSEDGEREDEMPIISWRDNILVISISRDAYVNDQKSTYENIQIEVIRREELQDSHPIGPLITAIQNPARTWNRDDLTAKVWQTCLIQRRAITPGDVTAWENLLDDDRLLKTDTSLKPDIHIREVALTCLEGLTGESFFPSAESSLPTRDYLAAGNNFKPERIRIVIINPKDLPAIHNAIQAWLKNHSKLN